MDQIDWALLTRYVNGTCSEIEFRMVKRWMEERPAHRRLVEDLESISKIASLPRGDLPHPETYVDSDWERLTERLDVASNSAPERDRRRRPGGRIRPSERRRPSVVFRRSASQHYVLRIAAILLIIVGGVTLLFIRDSGNKGASSPPVAEREAITEAGERGHLTLSDGTRVQLNVRSSLQYPRFFEGSTREVRLSGEAFFEVKSDSSRPFIVHANGATVRVRGTSFGIRAYDVEEEVKVVVVEGVVDLTTSGAATGRQETVSLSKDDLGKIVTGRMQEVVPNVDPSRHLGWQDGMLIFEDTPFERVAVELENWYDLSIHIRDPRLARRPLTATFRNESPALVLEVLSTALNANYVRAGPDVTFYLPEDP